jgi:hypothetical protein
MRLFPAGSSAWSGCVIDNSSSGDQQNIVHQNLALSSWDNARYRATIHSTRAAAHAVYRRIGECEVYGAPGMLMYTQGRIHHAFAYQGPVVGIHGLSRSHTLLWRSLCGTRSNSMSYQI